jgi:hypothetical protein
MARYRDDRDDEDDEEDDRPRRRKRSRRDDEPPKSNLPVILLVVGLAVGLPILGCVGFGVWVFFETKKGFDSIEAGFEASSASDTFFEALSRNDVNAAYQAHTTDAFKAGTSKDAFARLVKANPVLTTDHWADSGMPPKPVGQKPNRTVTLTYTVSQDDPGMDDFDPDDQPQPPRGRPQPPPQPKAAAFKTVTCTVVVAEQPNGTWKVDKFSIP